MRRSLGSVINRTASTEPNVPISACIPFLTMTSSSRKRAVFISSFPFHNKRPDYRTKHQAHDGHIFSVACHHSLQKRLLIFPQRQYVRHPPHRSQLPPTPPPVASSRYDQQSLEYHAARQSPATPLAHTNPKWPQIKRICFEANSQLVLIVKGPAQNTDIQIDQPWFHHRSSIPRNRSTTKSCSASPSPGYSGKLIASR